MSGPEPMILMVATVVSFLLLLALALPITISNAETSLNDEHSYFFAAFMERLGYKRSEYYE